ncbi:MAG: sugar phosphate isomerase/epimerase [Thermoguttaceae bacterium]|nr:sugar phosphate isomerase/epimerase [Thermoguttaceae bacterium]MDO4425244.1 sugar phosphate isomerase/epimerase family protein [Planctomycetia bacterium]
MINRREMLKISALASGSFMAAGALPSILNAAESKPCKVGIWSSNFDQARSLGLDCLQVSLPLRPTGKDLRVKEEREKMLAKSAETGIEITSLAMGEFNGNPFWKIPDAVEQVSSCIDVMAAMNVKHVLISYFGKGRIDTDEKYEETIKRFRELAPKAEENGVILTIEAPMKYHEHLRLIEGIDSPAVRIFYDPGNMIRLYSSTEEVCEDIIKLKGLIVAAHAKDSTILGKGKLDYVKIFKAYREAGYSGTQVIEGSIDRNVGWEESIRQGAAYLRSIR